MLLNVSFTDLGRSLDNYWRTKYSHCKYINEICKFSQKTGVVINENGLLDISVSYDPSESYDTTEQQAGASKICDNSKFSPSTIIYTSDIIGYGENYRKYKINLFDKQMSTSNCSVGRTAPSRTTAYKRYNKSEPSKAKTLMKY